MMTTMFGLCCCACAGLTIAGRAFIKSPMPKTPSG
jgi:hypothetical protein